MSEHLKRVAQRRLDGLLLEGLGSGPAESWTEADVESIRTTVRDTLAKGRCSVAPTRRGERRPRARIDVIEQAVTGGSCRQS